ncbi:MAG: hypothetical protein CL878_05885 [Dehalococcoidia bacterium]|nr:hypothetical protein [Dehalococcoidia bacterium]
MYRSPQGKAVSWGKRPEAVAGCGGECRHDRNQRPPLVLTTDQGATGWGPGTVSAAQQAQYLSAPITDLINPDVGTFDQALPLDRAVHELAGHILGQLVGQLLGAKGARQTAVYSGAIYFDDLLEKAGLPAAPHTWAWCMQPRYVAQLAAGVGNVLNIEGIPGESAGVDYTLHPIVDGSIAVSDVPGFGLPLDHAKLAAR